MEPMQEVRHDEHAAISPRAMTRFFKALSDQTRQQILQMLNEQERTVGEIVNAFELSQPTISRHLAVLREAHLVTDQRNGQFVYYRLNDDTLAFKMAQFFGRFERCHHALDKADREH